MNPRQTLFTEAVNDLHLKFPVAEIAEKTGYSEGTVSQYLSGKLEVSKKFLQRFCEVYNQDFNSIWNVLKIKMPPKEVAPNDLLTDTLQEILRVLVRVDNKLNTVDTNLDYNTKRVLLNEALIRTQLYHTSQIEADHFHRSFDKIVEGLSKSTAAIFQDIWNSHISEASRSVVS